MDPIGERALWFVLGLLAGWASVWLVVALRRSNTRSPPRPELHSPPQPEPASPVEELAEDYPHTPGVARLIDVSAARATGFNMKHAEDLTIIEGIGPKIEELLRAHGIAGFAQLAQLNEHELRDLLDRGGPYFRYANPASWAQQAALAVQNRWAELKQLQHELSGTR